MSSAVPVRQRRVGALDVSLSQLSFGSMRIDPSVTVEQTAAFLASLFDAGVDTHHSSLEYDSFDHYSAAVRSLRSTGRSPKHIVKLAEPSFDDVAFDAARFVAAIDSELLALSAETIENVQWLVRTPDPVSDVAHRALLGAFDDVRSVVDELKSAGKVRSVSAFPYSAASAQAIIEAGFVDAQCVYLNLAEIGDLDHLGRIPTIALRPLSGGAISAKSPFWSTAPGNAMTEQIQSTSGPFDNGIGEMAMTWPLLHPGVATVVVSLANDARLGKTLETAGQVEPDLSRFLSMRSVAMALPAREELLACAAK